MTADAMAPCIGKTLATILLIHWGWMKHVCVGNLTIIGPDNGLSPGRRQAIIWTNAGILLIGPWGTNISEILSETHTFSFNKMHLKMLSGKWRPFCLGLNVLTMCSSTRWIAGACTIPMSRNDSICQYWWLSVRLQYLQCFGCGDTAVLH